MHLKAGANVVTITPTTPQFLCGFPHVRRISTGVDTELCSSALFLEDGSTRLLMVANDLLFLAKPTVSVIRERIGAATGLAAQQIMITCTHTHSGPLTIASTGHPEEGIPCCPDEAYMNWLVERIVAGAAAAVERSRPAECGFGFAASSMVGGNRRNPDAASNSHVPVMFLRECDTKTPLALLLIVCVHPTVLHEDSTLVSADFPGYTRARIQQQLGDLPVIYHTGPSGNQSPRHVARENTVAEACRLGFLLGDSVLQALSSMEFAAAIPLGCRGKSIELPFNEFGSVSAAAARERVAFAHFERLRQENLAPHHTRTAECDWFGAERRLTLASLQASGELRKLAQERCLPAEVQVFQVGPWTFVAWPGEVFVEYALALKAEHDRAFAIAYANGETLGYLVTREAAAEGGYEASTATFKSPESAEALLAASCELLTERQT